jgi:hypothetical protein
MKMKLVGFVVSTGVLVVQTPIVVIEPCLPLVAVERVVDRERGMPGSCAFLVGRVRLLVEPTASGGWPAVAAPPVLLLNRAMPALSGCRW